MANKESITVVALLENDPITGVKYGEQKIILSEDEYGAQPTEAQKQYDKYVRIKARNNAKIKNERTKQK